MASGGRVAWRTLTLTIVSAALLVGATVTLVAAGIPPWPAVAAGTFAACFVMVVGLTIHAWLRERARRAAVRQHCGALGLEHTLAKQLPDRRAPLSLFAHIGELRRGGIVWIARDPSGASPLTIFEHAYIARSGNSTRRVTHTVAAVPCPAAWPDLYLTRKRLGHKVTGLFGRRDISVENNRFNRECFVSCADETFAVLVLTPDMQDWLLANAGHETFRIGWGLAVCIQQKALDPRGIDRLVGLLDGFTGHLAPELAAYESSALDVSGA